MHESVGTAQIEESAVVGCTIITPWGWPLIRCPSRRSAVCAAVCLCLPFIVSACGSTGSSALFSLHVTGMLVVGHYDIPPVYRHLVLDWRYPCATTGSRLRLGIRIDAFRGGDPTKRRAARAVMSRVYMVPASPGEGRVAGGMRIAIYRANYVVLSVSAPVSRTAYYDLSTHCAYQMVATGERR